MATLEFKLAVVSPMFLNGADPRQPEPRAASVRGQLRYWLRAYLGAQTDDLKRIWEDESAIFGSTEKGAAVSVRLFGSPAIQPHLHPMLPHREGTQENVSKALAIDPNEIFTLQLVTRPGVALPQGAQTALKLWLLLGGIGKRSRRMMGKAQIRPKGAAGDWLPPDNLDDLKNAILAIMPPSTSHPGIPSFPTLHKDYSWIIVGEEAYDSAKEANQVLFRDLLRNSTFRPKQDTFGFARGNKRRASPIIAQVYRIGANYHPVITAFYSAPSSPTDKDILRGFMKAASSRFSGIHVWGGW